MPDKFINRVKTHQMLPSWQRDNASRCEAAILKLLSESGCLRSLTVAAVRPGRKLRASLAIQYAKWMSIKLKPETEQLMLLGLSKAELLHSASCILDDIIDGDTVRRGQPVFHVREGLPQAILTAQELIATACSTESLTPTQIDRSIQDALIRCVREALQGEACDSFHFQDTLKYLPSGMSLQEAYLKKTTPGFAVAHRIVGIVCGLSEVDIERAAKFGAALGAFYQCANDYHDWFSLSPNLRGEVSEQVLISLCIPTITALDENVAISDVVGTKVPRTHFANLIQTLRDLGIERSVRAKVDAARNRVLETYPTGAIPEELTILVSAIDSPEFWGYKYAVESETTHVE